MGRNRRVIQTEKKDKTEIEHNRQQGIAIRCPACGGQTRVTNSIAMPTMSIHARYRQCDECGVKVYTEESIMRVVKQRPRDEKHSTD